MIQNSTTYFSGGHSGGKEKYKNSLNGAVVIAKALGVSELIIGLTIVAVGTSLPEVATSVVATIRGERYIAVGNAVGNNLFNMLAVLGLASMASLEGIKVSPIALHFDISVMIAVTIICLPVFLARKLISRGEGVLLLGCYGFYIAYIHAGNQAGDIYS